MQELFGVFAFACLIVAQFLAVIMVRASPDDARTPRAAGAPPAAQTDRALPAVDLQHSR